MTKFEFNRTGETAADLGEWFTYAKAKDGTPLRFRVRRVPIEVETAIERRYLGKRRKAQVHREGKRAITTLEYDVEAQREAGLEKAVYALVDSENCAVRPTDAGAASLYTQLLGAPVSVGESITLDGRWNEAVKRDFLGDQPQIAAWVMEKAAAVALAAQEDEEGKDETS